MDAKTIHQQSEQARENGDFEKALELADRAEKAYESESDQTGVAEVYASRSITYRLNGDLTKAKEVATKGVEIAKASGKKETLAIPLFNLAKVQEELGEVNEAVNSYKQAFDNITQNPPKEHNRPATIADMKLRLAIAQYKTGDMSALVRAQGALADLESAEEDKYNKDVWLAGAHMHMAEMLKENDIDSAREHLERAKEIINANPDLKIRKEQLEKLSAGFS